MRRERHEALPLRTLAAVVFVAEGDASLVVGDHGLIGDGDPVGVAREIDEYGLGAAERRLGVDRPSFLPERGEMAHEAALVDQIGLIAEEGELADRVQCDQPGQKQAAAERAQDPNRQEEGRTRR